MVWKSVRRGNPSGQI